MTAHPPAPRRKARTLAIELVEIFSHRIREGGLAPGDKLPTEAAVMEAFSVSRTVVREAISRLHASGLVETRHGIGTFVALGGMAPFRIDREQLTSVRDVIALLELRIGVESEAAGLAAQRRTPKNLKALRAALRAIDAAIEADGDTVGPDFQFHLEIARATQNEHFAGLISCLGLTIIPRARLANGSASINDRTHYLRQVNAEHESILDAIAARDTDAARAAMRTHLANSRERRRRAAAL